MAVVPSSLPRRAAALAVVMAAALGWMAPSRPAAAVVAPAPAAAPGPEAQEASVLTAIAQLSDQVEGARLLLVEARMAAAQAEAEAADAHRVVAGVAVDAYLEGTSVPPDELGVPEVYIDAANRSARHLAVEWRTDVQRARTVEDDARARLSALQALQARLDVQRQALDVLVAADQARIQRQTAADAAALAASDAARARAMAAGADTPGHAAATAAQQAVMARYPFGPLTSPSLPPRLVPVGPVLAGVASWYGPGFDGRPTATGAIYDEDLWTAASPDLPLGSAVVVSLGTRSVMLLVNDRGPYVAGRIIDLSHAAATALGFDGLAQVSVQPLSPA
ncbi:MAG TPA: septal ring lytic transglycosylase RlpA family protein [Acidimicrobiales bacterium]|nr:septal ring lytic transglycosylase RlpA family protein [Acidimicrobiales bacterium]